MIIDDLNSFGTMSFAGVTTPDPVISSSIPLTTGVSALGGGGVADAGGGVDPFGGHPLYACVHITSTFAGAAGANATVQFVVVVSKLDGGFVPDYLSQAHVVGSTATLNTASETATGEFYNQLQADDYYYIALAPTNRKLQDYLQTDPDLNSTLIMFAALDPQFFKKLAGGYYLFVLGITGGAAASITAGAVEAFLTETPGPGVNKTTDYRSTTQR